MDKEDNAISESKRKGVYDTEVQFWLRTKTRKGKGVSFVVEANEYVQVTLEV
jgi:hypothetical protein